MTLTNLQLPEFLRGSHNNWYKTNTRLQGNNNQCNNIIHMNVKIRKILRD